MPFYQICGFLIILYFILKYWQTGRYYAKWIFFLFGLTVASCILPLPAILFYPKRDTRIVLWIGWGVRLTVRLLGLEYEIRGTENVDRNRGGIMIVAPHQSLIDIAVNSYLSALIDNGTMVAKTPILYSPCGIGAWLAGVVFIDRKNQKKAVAQLLQQSDAIKKKSLQIAIFGEVSRAQEGKILPFANDAFHLAIDSQSMIQPVVVSKYHFLDSKNSYFGKGKIIVSILPAISCKGMSKDDVTTLLDKTKLQMDAHFEKISNETKP